MNPKFKEGDIVQLKSGGPEMTVSRNVMTMKIRANDVSSFNGNVECVWFEGNTNYKAFFNQDTLDLITNHDII